MIPKLKTLIVEDSPSDMEVLLILLKRHEDVFNVSKTATTFEEARDILARESFDLTILDIVLNDGKEARDLLPFNRNQFGIIAPTSIYRYELADKQLEFDSPITFPKPHTDDVISKFLIRLLERWNNVRQEREKRFVIRGPRDNRTVLCEQIYFIESDSEISRVYVEVPMTEDPKGYIVYPHHQALGKAELELSKFMFHRCSKSCIVNVKRILKHKQDDHDVIVLFREQDKFISIPELSVRVSRRYKSALVARGYIL